MEDTRDIGHTEAKEDTEGVKGSCDDSQSECNDHRLPADHWDSEDDSSLEKEDIEWGRVSFRNDVENVEFPISSPAGTSDVAQERKVHTRAGDDPHLMLHLIGDQLGDGGSTSAADTGVLTVVSPTLPDEMVKEVLLRSSAAEQARCRAVCKAWLAILTDPEFPRRSFLQSLLRTTPPPLCGVRFCPLWGYWPRMESWRLISPLFKALKLDLSCLPEVFLSEDTIFYNCSASGVMCITLRAQEGMHVCVFNPLNQSFKVLPMLQNYWGFHFLLLIGTVTATRSIPSFMLFVSKVGLCPKSEPRNGHTLYNDFAIYSSITGDWKGILGHPEAETCYPPAWAWNGNVYAKVDSTPPRLVRLSTETRGPRYLWDVALPDFEKRRNLHWQVECHLAEHRGRLLCCCGGIWMLDDAQQQWIEIAGRCPPDLLPIADPNTQKLVVDRVHVSGDLVVFFYQIWFHPPDSEDDGQCSDYHGMRRKLDCPVAYDILGRRWRKVPKIVGQVKELFQAKPHLRLSSSTL